MIRVLGVVALAVVFVVVLVAYVVVVGVDAAAANCITCHG